MNPSAALFHKDYHELPKETKEEMRQLLQRLMELTGANAGGHSVFHDDMFVWFRNLFFTTDPKFDEACGSLDFVLRARLWRLYTLCWACVQSLRHEGSIVDIGTYDGKALEVVLRYAQPKRLVMAYDFFDEPPEESRKRDHGPELWEKVKERLKPWDAVVHKGDVTKFLWTFPQNIAFCQIDLNDAEAESKVFPAVYERMTPGGIVVFDDYGFARYRNSALAHQKYLEGKEQILELPTGQGLFIKA